MSESNFPEELNIEYRFVDKDWKQQYILARIADAERAHFELMVDRLEEGHSEYNEWYGACQEVVQEIDRLKYIYRQMGGSFGAEFVTQIPDDIDG